LRRLRGENRRVLSCHTHKLPETRHPGKPPAETGLRTGSRPAHSTARSIAPSR